MSIVWLLPGCTDPDRPPRDLIPMEGMADILEVIYVSEVKAIRQYDLKAGKEEYMRKYLYPAIFDSLGVEDSLFYRSYGWYERRPEIFEVLMDSVAGRIERMPVDTSSAERKDGQRSLDDVYEELDRIESVRSGANKQPYDEQ